MGTFRVLLVDSGSASRVEVSKLLATCRYQVRRPSCEQQLLLCQTCAPPWCCSQPPGRQGGRIRSAYLKAHRGCRPLSRTPTAAPLTASGSRAAHAAVRSDLL